MALNTTLKYSFLLQNRTVYQKSYSHEGHNPTSVHQRIFIDFAVFVFIKSVFEYIYIYIVALFCFVARQKHRQSGGKIDNTPIDMAETKKLKIWFCSPFGQKLLFFCTCRPPYVG